MAALRLTSSLATILLPASIALGAGLPVEWRGVIEITRGEGEKGPWQQNESRYFYVDDPTVAAGKDGRTFVAWVDQARKDVFFQRLAPDGSKQLSDPVDVSRNPATFSWLPRIALTPNADSVYVLWQEIIFSGGSHGGDILFARSEDGGTSFSQPINLSQSVAGDGKGRISKEIWHNGSFDLVAGPDGAVYAAWTAYEGALWFSRSNDGGKSFSRPRHVAGSEALPARGPSLALGPLGEVHLAWTVGEDQEADIHFATSADGGESFGEIIIVASNSTYSDGPKLGVAPDGTVHLVYAESTGGPFVRSDIRYTRLHNGRSSFEAPRVISHPLPRGVSSAGFPALEVDAKNRIYVSWELYPNAGQRPRGLGMTVSRNGGESFSAPEAVPASADPAGGSNGSHQGLLMDKLAVDADGTITLANSVLKRGEFSRVWLIRGQVQPKD